MAENVNHPAHYNTGDIEVIDAIEAWDFGEGFNRGDAIKYIVRAGRKDPETEIEDLEKAKWYIEREIRRMKRLKSIEETGDYAPTDSHSEKNILKGCVGLMHELTGAFREYLEYVGFEPDEEEEPFSCTMSWFHIVNRLFLWNTTHSGGTSTDNKCRELGIFDNDHRCDGPTFDFSDEEDE